MVWDEMVTIMDSIFLKRSDLGNHQYIEHCLNDGLEPLIELIRVQLMNRLQKDCASLECDPSSTQCPPFSGPMHEQERPHTYPHILCSDNATLMLPVPSEQNLQFRSLRFRLLLLLVLRRALILNMLALF